MLLISKTVEGPSHEGHKEVNEYLGKVKELCKQYMETSTKIGCDASHKVLGAMLALAEKMEAEEKLGYEKWVMDGCPEEEGLAKAIDATFHVYREMELEEEDEEKK
jgi:hypothetical protein